MCLKRRSNDAGRAQYFVKNLSYLTVSLNKTIHSDGALCFYSGACSMEQVNNI